MFNFKMASYIFDDFNYSWNSILFFITLTPAEWKVFI